MGGLLQAWRTNNSGNVGNADGLFWACLPFQCSWNAILKAFNSFCPFQHSIVFMVLPYCYSPNLPHEISAD